MKQEGFEISQEGIPTVCSYCYPPEELKKVDEAIFKKFHENVSHGVCKRCFTNIMEEMDQEENNCN